MKALVLAAGYATRLYPLTEDCPKPLLDVAGKPVVEYILAHLEKIDAIGTIYMVVNEKFFGQFEEWKKKYRSSKTMVLVNDGSTHEDNRLGAIGDLRLCIQTQQISEDLLVVAGDNLFDSDLAPFVRASQKRSPSASMMVYDVKDLKLAQNYGIVALDQEGKIVSFEEKPKAPKSTLSAMGVYYFPKEVLGKIEVYLKGGSPQDAPGFFIRWLHEKDTVYGVPCEGIWYDIGDVGSYHRASEAFKREGEK